MVKTPFSWSKYRVYPVFGFVTSLSGIFKPTIYSTTPLVGEVGAHSAAGEGESK
jgi:hypothetical protein